MWEWRWDCHVITIIRKYQGGLLLAAICNTPAIFDHVTKLFSMDSRELYRFVFVKFNESWPDLTVFANMCAKSLSKASEAFFGGSGYFSTGFVICLPSVSCSMLGSEMQCSGLASIFPTAMTVRLLMELWWLLQSWKPVKVKPHLEYACWFWQILNS